MPDKIKILAIDDEPFNIEILEFHLSEDHNLLTAENGPAGLKTLEENQDIEIILLDVSMPEMDGYEVCEKIREDSSLDNTAVIFVSARGSAEERMKGYQSGGDDYLVKPFNKDELKAKIQLIKKHKADKKEIGNSLQYATSAAMEAMTGSSEIGLALQFVDASIKANNYPEVAKLLLESLEQFGLNAAIRVSNSGNIEWYQSQGQPSPLEKEMIELISSKDRIFSFQQRTQFNFSKINLLVKNMPVDEETKYGRYKDLIPFLLDSANARLQSIDDSKTLADHEKLKTAVKEVNKLLNSEKDSISEGQDVINGILTEMIQTLEARIPFMGLDDEQETFILGLIETKVEEAGKAADLKEKTDATFDKITSILETLVR